MYRWHMIKCLCLPCRCQCFPPVRCSYMQGGATRQKVVDNGAAINMHLAASLFVLRQTSAAGESAPSAAESPSRNTASPPPATATPSDPLQSPRSGPREDAGSRTNATLMRHNQKSLSCVVGGATRASIVATELSNAPMVDLVAGVLDAEATRLREEGMENMVKSQGN